MNTNTQETRSERATVTLTPTEKRAVKAVSLARDTDESNLLRDVTMAEVMEEWGRIQQAVNKPAA